MRSVALALLLVACGAPDPDVASYAAPGPSAITQRTYTYVDTSRPTPANGTYPGAPSRSLTVEVWAPAAAARAPLLIFAHGFGESRLGDAYVGEHLASWGFVVAAPDFPLSRFASPGGPTLADIGNQPGDVSFVIDRLLAEPAVGALVDPAAIGVSGLSLGGGTALLVAYHARLRDPRVRVVLALAPLACAFLPAFYEHGEVPLVIIQGDDDLILPFPENGARAIERARDPKLLAVLAKGTHFGFSPLSAAVDQASNLDLAACPSLVGALETGGLALGDETAGISADLTQCPLPCTGQGTGAPMPAERQLSLTRAILRAGAEAWLRGDEAAQRFLTDRLDAEADVTVRQR